AHENSPFAGNGKQATAGFSMLEMMIVCAITMIVAGITAVAWGPVQKQQRVTAAYNSTLTTLRRAHDQAAGDMRIYVVTFTAPQTITVQQAGPASTTCQIPPTGAVLLTTVLPPDVSFQLEAGLPTSNTVAPTTPDALGNAAFAIDFDEPYTPGSNAICFNPDGTATDQLGNINSGVVYMGRTNDVYSARAISLEGATGRIRGWRLYNVSGVKTWRAQ
ncbi:MAG TPA: prepilin-type N-terminal cleavage/methylation domain-containing protein, partial [Verrucomicrobiae bacterium]|nr:prepilin-type N-terminal cleavage/methylation domain-containing protein [Verrucomicrobiae bacterium]